MRPTVSTQESNTPPGHSPPASEQTAKMFKELTDTINLVQQRRAAGIPYFRLSSAGVQAALVEPILQALDWETADPFQVQHYDHPEAKRLRVLMLRNRQGITQAEVQVRPLNTREVDFDPTNPEPTSNADFLITTDGNRWLLQKYRRDQTGLKRHHTIADFTLEEMGNRAALVLSLLWKQNVTAEEPFLMEATIPPEKEDYDEVIPLGTEPVMEEVDA